MKRTVERLENGNLRVTVAFCFRNRNNNRKIVVDGEEDIPASTSDTLMLAIARGRRWQRYIDEGRFKNGTELAHAIGREPGKVAWTMRLAMLAPDIIHRILVCCLLNPLHFRALPGPFAADASAHSHYAWSHPRQNPSGMPAEL